MIIRPAACRLRTDAFSTREREVTTGINFSYTNTIADSRIDAAAMDHEDCCKGYFGVSFHYVILIDGSVEIGRNPRTISSRGRSPLRRLETLFVGVVGGLNFETGKREDTITEAQRSSIAELEQAIADTLNTPLDVIDFTVDWKGRAKSDQAEEAKEAELEEQLDRTEQTTALLC